MKLPQFAFFAVLAMLSTSCSEKTPCKSIAAVRSFIVSAQSDLLVGSGHESLAISMASAQGTFLTASEPIKKAYMYYCSIGFEPEQSTPWKRAYYKQGLDQNNDIAIRRQNSSECKDILSRLKDYGSISVESEDNVNAILINYISYLIKNVSPATSKHLREASSAYDFNNEEEVSKNLVKALRAIKEERKLKKCK